MLQIVVPGIDAVLAGGDDLQGRPEPLQRGAQLLARAFFVIGDQGFDIGLQWASKV